MNPQQPNQPMPQQPMPAQHYAAPVQQQPRRSRGWLPWTVLAAIVVIALVVIGIVFRSKLFPSKTPAEKLSGYEAVFLTNGQVYFGKLSHSNDQYVELTSIYYLQVNQALQADGTPAATGTGTAANTAAAANSSASNQSTQLSLVKLGNELHGPADEMQINRDQILFFEDLKANGQVAQAIAKYQQSGGTAGAANSNPAQGTNQAPAAGSGTSNTPATGTGTGTGTGTTGTNGSTQLGQ